MLFDKGISEPLFVVNKQEYVRVLSFSSFYLIMAEVKLDYFEQYCSFINFIMANKAESQAQTAAANQGNVSKFRNLLSAKKSESEDLFTFDIAALLNESEDEEGKKIILCPALENKNGVISLQGIQVSVQGQIRRVLELPCFVNGKKAKGTFYAAQIRQLLQCFMDDNAPKGVKFTDETFEVISNKMIQRRNGELAANGSLGVYSLTSLEAKNFAEQGTTVPALQYEEEG